MGISRIAVLSAAVLVGTLAFERSSVAAEELIGYVNLQRAIVEVEDGKKAKSSLEATFKKKQASLRGKEKELEDMQKALQDQGLDPSDPAAQAKMRDFQKKFLALRETLMKEQQELKRLEAQALGKITKRMRGIIADMGKAGGYTLILEAQESSLLFAKNHLDLTNEVIRKYNQASAKKKAKK
ncbi:MAG: OmpH family outer membrane protein [Myxococcota bacterium]